ncbi:phage late control D family protein [Spartinivicinus ruber]|uniref:phage late control D family protein n=1 Tax=Spartinivicinus ruber TaxID=2683272 RepID=UPI0013D10C5A|nr:contractile injection system protein, VgrG/Pvc8 family [Spartinivicinus ruber]
MGLTPVFKVVANSVDITQKIQERLLLLQVTDCAGIDSDTLEIKLDDRDHKIALPATGAKLMVWLGYQETGLVRMGTYIVDEIEITGPPWAICIRGKAADMRKEMKAPRTEKWQKAGKPSPYFPLTEIVSTVAARYQLEPRVGEEYQQAAYPVINQTDESDLHLLSRLAKDLGAIAKPAGNYLLFVKRGKGKSVSGIKLPTVNLQPTDITDLYIIIAERGAFQSVTAKYEDQGNAKTQQVTIGEGKPCHTIRKKFKTQEEAAKAAKAKLDHYQRGEASIEINLPGKPELMAEADLSMVGFRDGVNGIWTIERVTHTLDSNGYKSVVEAATKE